MASNTTILFPPEMACFSANMTPGVALYDDNRLYCPPGFYCPNTRKNNPISTPRICPASSNCGIDRLLGFSCEPQGPFEPQICPQRYYCPNSEQKIICPKGSFCPLGSFEPTPCIGIYSCPEGSFKTTVYDGLVACAIIDFLLIVALSMNEYFKKRRNETLNKVFIQKTSASEKESAVELSKSNMEDLVNCFRRGLDGRKIKMDFKFTDMSLKIGDSKTILNGVNGEIKSSRMTAIMGPSGAGKTTFMNVLCGKVSRTSGTLSISGKVAEIHQFKKLIGYVPQEDTMLRELTIRDILLHSARIRLPHTWSDKDMQQYVDVILDTLNLTHVQHVNIGDESQRGISGGQRKRVNIGIELCAIPTCLFLDEPTSGLDSTAALEVCDVLRQISHLGLTIVSVIHQPRVEIFKQFDDIFLIAPGGRTAYLGPTAECQPYFESLGYYFDPEANPADVLMDILSGKSSNSTNSYTADDMVRLWAEKQGAKVKEVDAVEAQHHEFHEVVPALIKERGANFFVQLWYCHYRSIIQQIALKNSFILEIFVGVLAGVVMGIALKGRDYLYTGMLIPPMTLLSPAIFEWVIPLMSFLMGVTATLAAAPAAVKVFSEERPVYWREASAGHNKLAYFLAKNFSVIYRILICSLHFAAPLHYLSKPVISFNSMYLMIISLYFGIYGISSVISMLVERSNASLLAVIVCLFHSVSAGFGLSRKQAAEAHIGWLFDICFNRWLTEILWTNSVVPFKQIYMIEVGTKFLGLTLSRVPFDFLMMFILGSAWRVIAFVFMLLTEREKQR